MKLIESSVQIIEEKDPYKMIELAGRTCYKSENNITKDSAKEFVDRMIKLGHGAMLEHGTIYLRIRETVNGNIPPAMLYWRHLTNIKPTWLNIPTGDYTYWDGDWCDIDNMKIQLPSDNGIADNFLWCLNNAGMQYRLLINKGLKPQEARAILPNATKTELVMTGFESDWEHFFELRCSGAAHPDARKLADELKSLMNVKNIELNSVK